MTNTTNLGMPFIDGSQAQKHVTHNDALRILDATVQIGVLTTTLTAPPGTPSAGDRHVVATGATGAWAGQAKNIATWEDGAWRFMAPKIGWFLWSAGDDGLFVYDGTSWRSLRDLTTALDNAAHIGVNTTASSPNLLTVRSNAALFNAIAVASGGTGDARIQISKESSAKTASVVFSDAFSGRAEFGLVGSDAFKLKVSNDGSTFVEALSVDQTSGNATLPRGLALCGVISPAQITSNQNDYSPTGLSSASVVQVYSDAARSITGLAAGAEGRVVTLLNTGSQTLTLNDESASSTAANRFTLGGDVTLGAKQGIVLRYDGTATRWYALARSGGSGTTGVSSLNGVNGAVTYLAGMHNRIINPSGQVWQRANSGAAAITDVTYAFDRWYGLTQSAGVTASLQTNVENTTPSMMRLSQANATAQRFGVAQAIEGGNALDLRGQQVILSARVRMSASTTLRYAIVEWTGTADTVTKDIVNDWTNGTFTTGNFFISTTTTVVATGSTALTANTLASISLAGTVSSSMNNLLVFFWTDSAQAQNVTFDMGKVQLEQGAQVTPLALRSIGQEQALCLRYYQINSGLSGGWGSSATTATFAVTFPVPLRVPPALTLINGSVGGGSALEITVAQRVVSAIGGGGVSVYGGRFDLTTASAGTFHLGILEAGAISFGAEL